MAYFQKGVSHFIMGDMEAAMQDFDEAYTVSALHMYIKENDTVLT